MKITLTVVIIVLSFLSCKTKNSKELKVDQFIHKKSCIKDFKIIRGESAGMDGMLTELSVYDSIYDLISEKRIIYYQPIHTLLSSYPSGFYPSANLNFDKENHVFSIRQGTIVFYKFKKSEFDSIQNLIMKDLVVVLIDKDSIEYKLYPCK